MCQNKQLYCGLDVDAEWYKTCLDEDCDTWTRMTGGVAETAMQDRQHDSDVEPSSDSDNAGTAQPAVPDTDVEPTDDSCNDSDHNVVMEKVRGLSFSTLSTANGSTICSDGIVWLRLKVKHRSTLCCTPTLKSSHISGLTALADSAMSGMSRSQRRSISFSGCCCFASDASHLFFAQYIREMKQIRDNIAVAMRKTAGRMSASLVSRFNYVFMLRQTFYHDHSVP